MPKHQIKTALGRNGLKFSSTLWKTFSHLLKPQILYTTFTHHQGSNKTLQLETVQLLHRSWNQEHYRKGHLQSGQGNLWYSVPIWDIPVLETPLPFLCPFSPTTRKSLEHVSLGYERQPGVSCFSIWHYSKGGEFCPYTLKQYHKHLTLQKIFAWSFQASFTPHRNFLGLPK